MEKAPDFLLRDRLLNIDIIECYRRGLAETLYAEPEGVLLHVPGTDTYLTSSDDPAFLKRAGKHFQKGDLLVVHQRAALDAVLAAYSPEQCNECRQAAFLGDEEVAYPDNEIMLLDETFTDEVYDNYHSIGSREYVVYQLRRGVMHGVFIRGKLAGFIGQHVEGSIGMLVVLEKYRRQGIASSLLGYMVNRGLERGETPYAQNFVGNTASENLQAAMGFTPADSHIWWMIF